MITETKMGVASTFRDVLKLSVKNVCVEKLDVGDYFEYLNQIFVYIGHGYAIDNVGFKIKFDKELVRPVKVRIEYDYVLLDENGREATYL